ncbi:hypothetical protein ACLB2K_035530 [Fragaria x ananassa]
MRSSGKRDSVDFFSSDLMRRTSYWGQYDPILGNVDGSLAVRCRYSGKGFMFSIHQRMNYSYLFEYTCERFRLSATDVIELHYALLGCPLSFLHNDNDFQMLFIGAKIYNLDCVEIIVEKNSEGCIKRTFVSCEDSCFEVLDEDDYLTEGLPPIDLLTNPLLPPIDLLTNPLLPPIDPITPYTQSSESGQRSSESIDQSSKSSQRSPESGQRSPESGQRSSVIESLFYNRPL